MADVAAYIYSLSGSAQQLGNDGSRRGFSVAPGHSNSMAGANVKKDFHLRR